MKKLINKNNNIYSLINEIKKRRRKFNKHK